MVCQSVACAGSLAASTRRAVSACHASGHRDCRRREGRRVSLSREGLVRAGSPYRTALRRSSYPYGAHGHDRHLGAHTTARGVVNATSLAPARGAGVAGGSPPGSSSSAFLRSVQRLDGGLDTLPGYLLGHRLYTCGTRSGHPEEGPQQVPQVRKQPSVAACLPSAGQCLRNAAGRCWARE